MDSGESPLATFLSFLNAAPEAARVAPASVEGPFRSLYVTLAALHVLRGQDLHLHSAHGIRAERAWRVLAADLPLPQSHALRAMTELAIPCSALDVDYPLSAAMRLPSDGTLMVFPIAALGTAAGTLTVHLPGDDRLTLQQHRLLDGVCAAIGLWLGAAEPSAPTLGLAGSLRVTPRQRQVLAAVRRGLTNAAIAAELGFAVGTIKADITAMSAIFGATGRLDLVRKAANAGF